MHLPRTVTALGSIANITRALRTVDVSDTDTGGADRAPAELGQRTQALPLTREVWLGLVRERMANDASLWIRVRGASMAPAIAPGTLVRLSPFASDAAPRIGDVVLAVLPSGLPVVHRVVSVAGDDVRLRGDALGRRDPDVRRDAILARVTAVRVDSQLAVPGAPAWPRLRWWRVVLSRWWRARFTRTKTIS